MIVTTRTHEQIVQEKVPELTVTMLLMYGIKASFCYYNFSMCPLYDITMVHTYYRRKSLVFSSYHTTVICMWLDQCNCWYSLKCVLFRLTTSWFCLYHSRVDCTSVLSVSICMVCSNVLAAVYKVVSSTYMFRDSYVPGWNPISGCLPR